MLLKHLNLSLEVPIGAELLPDATKLATDFAIEAPVVTSELELLALFIHYCSTRSDDIALALFDHLSGDFLGSRDVYLAIQELGLGEEQARIVLKGYYSVWSLTEHHGSLCIPPTLPALFSDPSVCLMAMFGGQSGTGDYVAEARWLVDIFRPLVGSYFDRMSAFLSDESRDPRISRLYEYGMDVAMWCADAAKQPQISYLLKPSVAIPVTGLIQLMHLMILYKTLGINPGDLTKYFKVAVGHSQGTVAAALLASVADEDSFYSLSEKALGILMLVGAYPELECFVARAGVGVDEESISREGRPSPMVSIRGLSRNQLDRSISEFNESATDLNAQVFLSLINTHDQFVVSGEADTLAMFVRWMRSKCAQPGEDQTRVPFSKRKPAVKMTYLTISRPYHCELLQPVINNQLAHAAEKGWAFAAEGLNIEIRASNDGHDIRQELDLTRHLFECTCALVVNFSAAIGIPTATHIVDFSPGGFSVFGTLAYANVEGRGISIISTSALTTGNLPLGTKAELFKQSIADVARIPNWQEQFAPRLVRTAHDHRLHIDTRMHRVLGQPPLMVAGMMPTTVNEHFVAAVKNAGYHAELGGAGIYNARMLKRKFDNLIQETSPGQAITLNCVYFNQRSWNFQYAEVLRLRKEGYPIAGVCIGAGVPSLEVANEILGNFRDVGIQHVAFKPGSAIAIRQVLDIAQANPDFPILLQWTGGRAGGHHSCEDFHEPLLETYSAIRSHPNIVLVLGSGFGDAEGTLPYLTGDWSIGYGRASMPVDGFLFASRVMVAKEANTSTPAKQLIVQATGVPDSEWEQTYSRAHGGVITSMSEYGEHIHAIATRSAFFIKELYEAVLSKPRDQQPALLNAKKDYYIQRLNADHMRPWFGRKDDGTICDLEDMTYLEVIGRLAELFYVKHQQRWIDLSYLEFFVRFLHRVEDRFATKVVTYEVQAMTEIDDPCSFTRHFASKYAAAGTTIISSEDIQYFISLCGRKGTKPVPFIPLFDENITIWLLKDAGWQSEDIDAIINQDIQRVLILQSPVSARYSTIVDEPVEDILDGIYNGQIQAILAHSYGGVESSIPLVDYVQSVSHRSTLPCVVPCQTFDDRLVYTLPDEESDLPSLDSWITELAGSRTDWLTALLKTPVIVHGSKYRDNGILRVIRPYPGQVLTIFIDSGTASRLIISQAGGAHPDVEISIDTDNLISVCIYHTVVRTVHPWELKFRYRPDVPSAMIHDENEGAERNYGLITISGTKRSSSYHLDDGFSDDLDVLPSPAHPIHYHGFVITDELIAQYCNAVGNSNPEYAARTTHQILAPTDLLFVIGTEGFFKSVTSPLACGFLNLVHRSNRFELANSFEHLAVGDHIDYDICVDQMYNTRAGKLMECQFTFYRGGSVFARMFSTFIFRDVVTDNATAFKFVTEPRFQLNIKAQLDIEILSGKEWLVFHGPYPYGLVPGDTLEFDISTEYRYKTDTVYSSIRSLGHIHLVRRGKHGAHTPIADIDFECAEALTNPVIEYLQRAGQKADIEILFDHEGIPIVSPDGEQGMTVMAPSSAWEYAKAAGDYNPIHTNRYVAQYAGLPSPIIHGMWTSASTKALIEKYAASYQPERIRTYTTEFLDMVLPGDKLMTKLFHIGMKDGRMLVKGETRNQHGNVVLTSLAEIDQPRTVYTFAGLGSQQVGMGMDLYAQSDAARTIWDRAEKHMLNSYGVSLLDIVRNSPSQLAVKFHGMNGANVQKTYMELTTESVNQDGERHVVRLFPQVDFDTDILVQNSEPGLLHSAQFTQPALAIFAIAQSADLKSKSLVQADAMFAGHSLGEFCALASLTSIFSVEDIIDITFYRGMLLHASVERDNQNRSQYGMAAVDPSRIGKGFTQNSLSFVVDTIKTQGGSLLELINYNVAGQQYVVTGHHSMLSALGQVLDTLYAYNINVQSADGREDIINIIGDILAQSNRNIAPRRSRAMIPLSGVDVPSHSTQLLPAVSPFRKYLLERISNDSVDYKELKGVYIPNVTAQPFEVSKDYIKGAYDVTKSPILADVLATWDGSIEMPDKAFKQLTRTLLVELLAYQFALPVRWIETQDVIFRRYAPERLVEISPTPTVSGMAKRTLSQMPRAEGISRVYHVVSDDTDIYYSHIPEIQELDLDTTPPDNTAAPLPLQQEVNSYNVSSTAPLNLPTPQAQAITDSPLKTIDVLRTLVAMVMKTSAFQIGSSKTIMELSGAKSTLQNEIISEMQKEFSNKLPDKAEEMRLDDLAGKIGVHSGVFGKQIDAHLARMFSTKMPGGYSQPKLCSHLEARYGLGSQRQLGVLLLALTLAPSSRLTADSEVNDWIHGITEQYGKHEGISYAASNVTSASSSAAVINSVEFQKSQEEQRKHIMSQVEVLARSADVDLGKHRREIASAKNEVAILQYEIDQVHGELGDEFLQGIASVFDARKVRHYNSYWNWARQDLYELVNKLLLGNNTVCPEMMHMLENRSTPSLVKFAEGVLEVLAQKPENLPCGVIQSLHSIIAKLKKAVAKSPVFKGIGDICAPSVDISHESMVSANFRGYHAGQIVYTEVARPGESTFAEYAESMQKSMVGGVPLLHMRGRKRNQPWAYSKEQTDLYFSALNGACLGGLTFEGKTALITGCGRGSIGSDILKGLLAGGAKVVATTSSYSHKTTMYFEDIYRQYGARGSELYLFPFNQGSVADVNGLVKHIFSETGLGWDLDFIIPFASVSDIGRDIASLDSASELALRIMMTNVMRLIGAVSSARAALGLGQAPSLVLVPLSPNHGMFGGDGFYGECKASLETLLNRWKSESWSKYISIIGVIIGWTRGTNMMDGNDVLANTFEALGARTFSTNEMAVNILCLLHFRMRRLASAAPLMADFGGGFQAIAGDMDEVFAKRGELNGESAKWKTLSAELAYENHAIIGDRIRDMWTIFTSSNRAKNMIEFPKIKPYEQLEHLRHLEGMINLDKVVVITGYGEVGPYGHAATRWEMEAYGEFSIEGCIELAWIMGLIKHHNGPLPNSTSTYIGWVDATTGEPVHDRDIKARYEPYILDHTGIRLLEPENTRGFDPETIPALREIQIAHDMDPFVATADEAANFKKVNGDMVDVWDNDDGTWSVKHLKGAMISVPMALTFDRIAAGQLPIGWNPKLYGIPDDLTELIDPVTLVNIISTIEALLRSGITDPYELYQYFHVSEIGNTTGSGFGGMHALKDIFANFTLDKDVKTDVLQESLINALAAWTNMLLISSAGPIKPMVGACGTAALSMDVAVETIQMGKAKMMIAGASEAYIRETSISFANIHATADAVNDISNGRTCKEMSRPCATTRCGFVESFGGGIVTLMAASAAIACGAPIYGVMAMTATATDKEGRTVPAPGKGILTAVRETPRLIPSRMLDFDYRRRHLERKIDDIKGWEQQEIEEMLKEAEDIDESVIHRQYDQQQFIQSQKGFIKSRAEQMVKDAKDQWSNEFWKNDSTISPLRGSLATWGLNIGDISVLSMHATSTVASDKNEPHVMDQQFKKLGRTPGYAVPAVCQKWLTGHPKGPSAAWMLNGVLQTMQTGIIPGNRNLDNVTPELEAYDHIVFPSKSIQTPGINAALVTSFGFGQVGAEILVLHPDFVHAVLSKETLDQYRTKVKGREQKSNRYWQDVLVGNHSFAQVKDTPPFTPEQEAQVYMDPTARAKYDPISKQYHF